MKDWIPVVVAVIIVDIALSSCLYVPKPDDSYLGGVYNELNKRPRN